MPASSDRNLLFGILALQMDFITREQLVAGMQAWVLGKDISLAEHLVRAGALRPEHRQLLEPLVEAHIRQHGDDPQQSLASISSFDVLRNELAGLGDKQVDASIAHIPGKRAKEIDPYATISVGAASSQGMRFRILRPHAEGGLGRVSIALDGELGREVALKEIKPERADDPDSRSRFTREAEITGGLEHPGIVPVYGLGAYPDGRPFYAMRFIRGKSLKEAIEKFHAARGGVGFQPAQKKLSPTEQNLELRKLLQRLIDVCEAMDYAHSRGVLHRDLKPGNIMLGKYGETLVVDWGLAKPLGKSTAPTPEQQQTDTTVGLSSLPETALQPSGTGGTDPTMLGTALGTPAFMSPEQAQGRLDLLCPASDVFSLGAILFQILTGRPPYVAPTKDELLRKAQDGDYALPRTLRRHISAPLEAICLKAMAAKSADRYQSTKEIVNDLEHWLADEPVSCLRDSITVRARRWMKRHRTLVFSSAAAVLVVVTSLAVLLAFVARQNNVLDAKNQELDYANSQLARTNAELKKVNKLERVAKEDADRQRAQAIKSGDETKQLFDFLVGAFRMPDPYFNDDRQVVPAIKLSDFPSGALRTPEPLSNFSNKAGEKITVVEMFDQVVKEADIRFASQPLFRARILSAIGDTYFHIGLYDKAAPLLERAMKIRIKELGRDHDDTMTSMNTLAVAYSEGGRRDEAVLLAEQALELSKAENGPFHPTTMLYMSNLAVDYGKIGEETKMLDLYRQTFDAANVILGPEHEVTLAAKHNLGSALSERARHSEAAPLLESSLKAFKKKYGPDHL